MTRITNFHYKTAAGITAINAAVYIVASHFTYIHRGYAAIGGEDLIFVVGILAALLVLDCGRRERRRLKL